jgi:hypothetical protein
MIAEIMCIFVETASLRVEVFEFTRRETLFAAAFSEKKGTVVPAHITIERTIHCITPFWAVPLIFCKFPTAMPLF